MPFKVDEGHVIVEAAVIGGVQYYTLKDVFNTFSERALSALDAYEEWDQRVTKADNWAFYAAVDTILSNPKTIKIGELAQMVSNMKRRVEWVLPTSDIIFRFAAIALFDEHESPYRYDESYGRDKIEKWKQLIEAKEISYDDFFFAIRTVNLIPLPDLSQIDLPAYLKVADMIQKTELKKILPLISPEDRKSGFYKQLILENTPR
jgi:hypothetical protein